MANRKLGCVTVVLFIALSTSLLVNLMLGVLTFSRMAGGSIDQETRPKFREIVIERGEHGTADKVAIISLRGLISSSIPGAVTETMVDDMRAALEQAREDEKVKAVILEIDSPGGEVTASDAIYHAVVKTRNKKPVIVYMESVAASGGYYIACGGEYLMASDTTITGSIGVIIQTLNYQQLFDKVGLAAVIFKSGEFKDMLNGARPVTPEEREYIQGFVMATYEKFLGIVAKERELSADLMRSTIADGRILSGQAAQESGLIDGLGQKEDAYAKARELGKSPAARLVKYGPPFTLGRFLRVLGENRSNKIELTLPRGIVPQLESGRAYFLPAFYAP